MWALKLNIRNKTEEVNLVQIISTCNIDIENISITQDILIAWYLKNYIVIVIIYWAFTAFYNENKKMYCIVQKIQFVLYQIILS